MFLVSQRDSRIRGFVMVRRDMNSAIDGLVRSGSRLIVEQEVWLDEEVVVEREGKRMSWSLKMVVNGVQSTAVFACSREMLVPCPNSPPRA